jgi:hypothetical protein
MAMNMTAAAQTALNNRYFFMMPPFLNVIVIGFRLQAQAVLWIACF